ncbi:MAG: hypothetical protein NTW23_02130 [Rhodoluna sp.]|nr:hypothetical protein [Rhodoluna sp.]
MLGLSKRQTNWLLIFAAFFIGCLWTWLDNRAKGDNSGYMLVVFSFAFLVSFSTYLFLRSRDRKRDALESLEKQMAILDRMSEGTFEEEDYVFATQKDEVVIARVNQTMLREFRSNGSTSSGGFGGVSFPVFGRVRGNVGGYSGKSRRNPEESTPIDVGTSTYTNQRIVFAGENVVREFDLDKLVNLEAGDNGITVTIAVSNRDKASVLASVNFDDLTPGIAASIAVAYQEGGKAEALKKINETKQQIQDALALERAKSAK